MAVAIVICWVLTFNLQKIYLKAEEAWLSAWLYLEGYLL